MAGSPDLLSALRRQLERLGDDDFAALASAGLVRRARKDLEALSPAIAEADDAVTVDLGAHRIVLDARGPAHARCTCPARTVCQHILAACLFLRGQGGGPDQPQPTAPAPAADLEAELMSIGLDALLAYAGKPAVRQALRMAEEDDVAEIEVHGTIVIRLRRPAVEFRYAGGGVDSLLTSHGGRSRKKLAALAVLAFQRAHGAAPMHLPGEEGGPDEPAVSADVAELRGTLLPRVERLLCECVDLGLPHLSDSHTERFLSLATVAEGARLHRLSLALSRLSDRIDLALERHAQADSAVLLADLARTYALATALRDPRAWSRVELIGEARTAYREIGELDLYCAAAFPWQTASGYWGLTTLFWSAQHGRWFSQTDARPVSATGFDPRLAYRTGGAWAACGSPRAITGAQVRLRSASANRSGRLSTSKATQATVRKVSGPPDFGPRAWRDWAQLRRALDRNLDGLGLVDRNPHDDYAVVYPARFLPRSFDGATQTLWWPLVDQNGDQLLARLTYSQLGAHAVERLDSLRPSGGTGVLVQLSWSRGELVARPLALLRPDRRPDNIHLDDAPRATLAESLAARLRSAVAALPLGDAPDDSMRQATATEHRLLDLEEALLRAAERGNADPAATSGSVTRCARRLHDAGLALLEPAAPVGASTILRLQYSAMIARRCLERADS
jgi:hypothetical protein